MTSNTTTNADDHVNYNGFDLSTLETGEFYSVERTDSCRTRAELISIDHEHNEYGIKYDDLMNDIEETVSGDQFYPHVTEVDDPITLDEFQSLEPDDVVIAYITGYETTSKMIVNDVNHDDKTVEINGYLAQYMDVTIHRIISYKLISHVTESK